ncbi:MAG: hypothetical protein AAFY88_25835, partial [Acidobacteriota bacterium]
RDRVDIEGSGRDVTFIVSDTSLSFSNATVRVPSNITAELRQLTVQHFSGSSGIGVDIAASGFLLTEVNIETKDELQSIGVRTTNSSPRLNEIFARVISGTQGIGVQIVGGGTVVTESFALASQQNERNVAWHVTRDANAVLERIVALASSAEENYAVLIDEVAGAELTNARGTALGRTAVGLYLTREATGDIKESTFRSLSDSFSVALQLDGRARAKATESTFEADPIALDHLSVFAVRLSDRGTLDSNQSNFDGTSFAAQNVGAGQGRFGASQLIGSVVSTSLTGFQCIFSYNGSYTARNALCL